MSVGERPEDVCCYQYQLAKRTVNLQVRFDVCEFFLN